MVRSAAGTSSRNSFLVERLHLKVFNCHERSVAASMSVHGLDIVSSHGLRRYRHCQSVSECSRSPPRACQSSTMRHSEYKLKSHLHDPRIASICDASKVTVRNRGVRVIQLRMIEEIEELGPILNLKSFAERECSVRREVDIECSRSDQYIAAGVAEAVEWPAS